MPALPRLPQTSPLYAPSPALLRLLETSRVVLGSASASRATILNQASVPFRVLKPNIDEKAIRFSNPVELVSALARAKTQALLDMKPECDFLIACDQVVVCDGEICEKPESKEEATERWRAYRTHHPSTVGSILVTHMPSGRQKLAVDKAVIKIKPLSDEDIQALVDEGELCTVPAVSWWNTPWSRRTSHKSRAGSTVCSASAWRPWKISSYPLVALKIEV